ncbi:MAG TPA: CsgG/HfaB family protein [Planctomycetota bacterium]|jgi:curli biogenesis system outer membrane secretion channel CsgG|nr:CsgG/HfaB family protein [Planctomycetota bacterium]
MNLTPFRSGSLILLVSGGCATAGVTSSGGTNMSNAQAEAYDGPKARIAVADFEDKMSSSGLYRAEYGRGMSDMLATALFQTNRYIVLEREKLSHVLSEQDLGASGRVRREAAAPIGEIEGAELLVTAAVTGFDPGATGGEGSITGGLGGVFGGLTGAFKQARVSIDLRVLDVRTSRVVAATSVEGTATGVSAGVGSIGGGLIGPLSGFANTPLEKAIRGAIAKAVEFVASRTPAVYYHFAPNGAPLAAVAPPPLPAPSSMPASAGVPR